MLTIYFPKGTKHRQALEWCAERFWPMMDGLGSRVEVQRIGGKQSVYVRSVIINWKKLSLCRIVRPMAEQVQMYSLEQFKAWGRMGAKSRKVNRGRPMTSEQARAAVNARWSKVRAAKVMAQAVVL